MRTIGHSDSSYSKLASLMAISQQPRAPARQPPRIESAPIKPDGASKFALRTGYSAVNRSWARLELRDNSRRKSVPHTANLGGLDMTAARDGGAGCLLALGVRHRVA